MAYLGRNTTATTLQMMIGCGLAMIAAGCAALALAKPMLFPSLGPTIMMVAQSPGQHNTAPRSVMLAHGAGLAAGAASLWVFGLYHSPSALAAGMSVAHIGAATLSIVLTAALTRTLDAPHPPAGATTLIVSLGLLPSAIDLASMALALALATIVVTGYNNLLGQPAPIWRANEQAWRARTPR